MVVNPKIYRSLFYNTKLHILNQTRGSKLVELQKWVYMQQSILLESMFTNHMYDILQITIIGIVVCFPQFGPQQRAN